jgi:hypothetical protein
MNGHFSPVAVMTRFLASVVLFGALADAFLSHIPIGTKINKAMVTPTLVQTTLLAEELDSATKGPKPIDFKSIMETQDAVFSTLCYDNFISERICVSRPYYMLENDKAVLADLENAIAFSCSVTPKMPLGRECGDMIGGEAGRHMAIAGSVAAALRQKPKSGKHYYLALDHYMTRHTFQGIGTAESGSSSIIATCVDFGKRTAKVEVLLETTGDHPAWHLEVEYAVIPKKVFKKMMRNTAQPEQVAIPGVSSPYKEFKGLPSAPTIVSSSCSYIKTIGHLPEIDASQCLGHFDGVPSMPIAFLSAYCCDLIAQSISALTNIPLEFKQDRERKCPLVHLLMGEMKAERLVSANTHGVTIECCVRAITDSMYHGKLALFSDDDGSEVAKGSTIFELRHGHQ